jgi:hypothetical protein
MYIHRNALETMCLIAILASCNRTFNRCLQPPQTLAASQNLALLQASKAGRTLSETGNSLSGKCIHIYRHIHTHTHRERERERERE